MEFPNASLSAYAAAIAAAPKDASLDPHLRQLLADRVHDWTTTDLLDLTYLVIVEAGDSESDILAAVGYSPFVNPLDDSRFGSPSFTPPWTWLGAASGLDRAHRHRGQ